MPLGISETSQEEIDALEALRDPNEQPLAGDDDEGATPAAETPADVTPPVEQPKAEAPADKPKGDVTQALRAARHAERRAVNAADRERAERERLQAELEALKAKLQESGEAGETRLDRIKSDFPDLGEELAELKLAVTTRVKPPEVAAEAAPVFEPERFEPAIQSAIEQTPDLWDWQYDPDQTRFKLAKAADGLLLANPAWQLKPHAERFAEVVRRVNAELAPAPAATPTTPRIDPQQAIDAAPTRTPRSLGEIGGGGGRQPKAADVARFREMSAEDVEAELMTRG